ncbi:MAG: hypothetical protein AAGB48_08910 [Planctomycetota bacterium]
MTRTMCRLVLCAGSAAGVAAQDSVSIDALGPGDAIDAADASRQVTRFVVDLDQRASSAGNLYRLGPVIKSSALPLTGSILPRNAGFRGQALSRTFDLSSPATGQFAAWSAPGEGVGPNNAAPTLVDLPAGPLAALGIAFADQADGTSSVIAGRLSFDPADRTRLYIERIVAATGSADASLGVSSSLAVGAVDAALSIAVRADGFALPGPSAITDDDILLIAADLRDPATVNIIDDSAAADASATFLLFDGSDLAGTNPLEGPLTVPQLLPTASGGPATFGATFAPEALLADHTTASLGLLTPDPAFVGLPTDASGIRGSLAVAPVTPLGGTATSAAVLADASGSALYLGLAGLDSGGLVTNNAIFSAPVTIQDNLDAYDAIGAPFGEFRNWRGEIGLLGAAGAAAVSQDGSGLVLAAGLFDLACATCDAPSKLGGTVTFGAGDANARSQGIAVLRFDPADPVTTAQWALAAWTNADLGTGKPIRDDSGSTIGRLITSDAADGISAPSIAGPSLDSQGNLVLVASYVDYGLDGIGDTTDDAVRNGLFRAVYEPASFAYDLELIIGTGHTATSQTGIDYRIRSLSLADSASEQTFLSGNATAEAFPGSTPADPNDPDSLGAVAVAATITYDANADGSFDTSPGTLDETYNTMLIVIPDEQLPPFTDCNSNGTDDPIDVADGSSEDINADGVPDECQITRLCADVNNDGIVTDSDFFAWVTEFQNGGYRGDVNNDGNVTDSDFFAWVVFFFEGEAGPLCVE